MSGRTWIDHEMYYSVLREPAARLARSAPAVPHVRGVRPSIYLEMNRILRYGRGVEVQRQGHESGQAETVFRDYGDLLRKAVAGRVVVLAGHIPEQHALIQLRIAAAVAFQGLPPHRGVLRQAFA